MNSITREDLQAFITAVEKLGYALALDGRGRLAAKEVEDAAERLKHQLDCDATIV